MDPEIQWGTATRGLRIKVDRDKSEGAHVDLDLWAPNDQQGTGTSQHGRVEQSEGAHIELDLWASVEIWRMLSVGCR